MSKMEDQGEQNDPDVGFLYKAMLRRDPRKRQVKPVQHHLLQLDFDGLSDSSDDSDYEIKPNKGGSGSEDDDSADGSTSDEDSEGQTSGDEDDSDGKEDEKRTSNTDIGIIDDSNSLIEPELLTESKASSIKALSEENAPSSVGSVKKMKIVICCVCLGDSSEEDDEIVDCDGCGWSVHEGCYGISDTESVASTVSSASTEPWFCDACKAGFKPHCELCPNFGGIFKETDTGRWVHIVCAMYIPGVAFGDIDKLSPVTLFEMPYSKWGAKECSLCEDERFCRTGVCISCDAGLCRNYFHVTCAQREGLLSEASPEEDIADPFFAYCKQHAEKNMARAKRRNFLAVQSQVKQTQDQTNNEDKDRTRVQRKLNRHRQKYQINKAKRPPPWVPTEKMPRMLFSSASALRKLMKKAELLGIQTQSQVSTSQKDIRKKWHLAPAFSAEFVSYFLDREERMKTMRKHVVDLESSRKQLQKQEHLLRRKYDKLSSELETLRKKGSAVLTDAENKWKQLSDISGKALKLPEVLRPKKYVRTPTSKKDPVKSPPLPSVIHQCGLCHKTTNQHLLAKCDTCRLYYHLGCLDPPLTRMPKKTKLMGWQCSECASSGSSDSDEPNVDTNAPRQLREKIKEPSKFTPIHKERKRSEVVRTDNTKRGRPKRKQVIKPKVEKAEQPIKSEPASPSKNPSPHPIVTPTKAKTPSPMKTLIVKTTKLKSPLAAKKATKNIKEAQKIVECCVCLKSGDSTSIVCCDNCQLSYHFLCLDPPQTKSPRYRGYAWFCSACEDDEDDDEEEDEESVQILENRSSRPSPWRRPYPTSGPIPAAKAVSGGSNPTTPTLPGSPDASRSLKLVPVVTPLKHSSETVRHREDECMAASPPESPAIEDVKPKKLKTNGKASPSNGKSSRTSGGVSTPDVSKSSCKTRNVVSPTEEVLISPASSPEQNVMISASSPQIKLPMSTNSPTESPVNPKINTESPKSQKKESTIQIVKSQVADFNVKTKTIISTGKDYKIIKTVTLSNVSPDLKRQESKTNETIREMAPGVQMKFIGEKCLKVSPKISESFVSGSKSLSMSSYKIPPIERVSPPGENVSPPSKKMTAPSEKITTPGDKLCLSSPKVSEVKRPAEELTDENNAKKIKLNPYESDEI